MNRLLNKFKYSLNNNFYNKFKSTTQLISTNNVKRVKANLRFYSSGSSDYSVASNIETSININGGYKLIEPPIPIENLKRGKDREIKKISMGDIIHGFRVTGVKEVPERQFHTYQLEHIQTGAYYFHIDCEDSNNVFSVSFKTVPKDSTGVAHILEHTTLCGSKQYPVRDPFFNMIKRSLNTYMNAWTGPDFTSYPFGTQHAKDYYNLMSVYLDACFFPILSVQDFRQEGHRLEFELPEDTSTPLHRKGIVFNEMKGALSDPSTFFSEQQQQQLYPGTTYSYNSGGDPIDIPSLTHKDLVNFHDKHYHPSNSYFFSYGDLPLYGHLKAINEWVLSHFNKESNRRLETMINKVERWNSPKRVSLKCAPTVMDVNPERKFKFSMSILLNDNNIKPSNEDDDSEIQFERLAMNMLSNLLLRGSNTPMYQSLIESGMALDYTPGTGYDDNLRESSFSIGGIGIKKDDLEKFENSIISTLEKAEKEGFKQEQCDSILHQYEFSQKDVSSNLGLKLSGGLLSNWIHGGNPVEPLFLNKNIERLRKEISSGPFFQKLIRKILDNPHRLLLTMESDPEYQTKESELERQNLDKIKQALTENQRKDIIDQALELQQRQNLTQNLSCLPKLTVNDIEKKQPHVDFHDIATSAWTQSYLRIQDLPTNGITYFRSMIDIQSLPEHLKLYLPLFCSVLDQLGAAEFDHKQLDTQINLYSGRFQATPLIMQDPYNLTITSEKLYLKSACINRNLHYMFELWHKILHQNRWNNHDLLKLLLTQRQSSLIESITSSGLSYAKLYSSSGLSSFGQRMEQWGGLSQVRFTNQLVSNISMDQIIENLIQIKNHLISDRSNWKSLLTAEQSALDKSVEALNQFLQSIPTIVQSNNVINNSSINNNIITDDLPSHEKISYYSIPSQVNYISKVYPGVPYAHRDSASLSVLSKVLSEYLHKEIREKGGAYGGGVSYDSGNLSFYSYRDPNLNKTIEAFKQSIHWSKQNITNDLIENAQLQLFSDIDSPESPSNKGVGEWMRGITTQMKQERRYNLLNITITDLVELTDKYLSEKQTSFTTVLGKSDELLKNDQSILYKTL
ncbi:peptidase M16 family protein [Tieghemostelium lacteum]|uniref:Presequence protease, mitochondrial n=1 Tax=Tieghemostelium lacteum TaxID=361077 RepID=A0A151ZJ57_TIELA|nr:peptidase M16 family protein [Tieghemostelium lacteum]|eukprot:KYQ93929.1 peptidase M16 family protein [Tieghemostelium lacteum]